MNKQEYYQSLIGKEFGVHRVLSIAAPVPGKDNVKRARHTCLCSRCGAINDVLSYNLVANPATYCSQCSGDRPKRHPGERNNKYQKGTVIAGCRLLERTCTSSGAKKWTFECLTCGNVGAMSYRRLQDVAASAKDDNYSLCRVCYPKGIGLSSDLTGEKFGKLTIVSRVVGTTNRWNCVCSCGNTITRPAKAMLFEGLLSCGCAHRDAAMQRSPDLIGSTFGKLTVLEQLLPEKGRSGVRWRCVCECGGESVRSTGYLNSRKRHSCGCDHPRLRTGPEHPCWKGTTIDGVRDRKRSWAEYDEARISAIKRDQFTCQACGKRGGKLAAHHIKPWASFKAHRFMKRNLVTLCKCCHDSFHKKYGKYDPDMWRPFIQWLRERREETGFVKLKS